MKKEFKVKNKIILSVNGMHIKFLRGILIGNEKFSVQYAHRIGTCFGFKNDNDETNVEIKEFNNYENYDEMHYELLDNDFKYLSTINAKESWIADDNDDINKIGERLEDGKYRIYCDRFYENFILLKMPEE